MTKEEYLSRVLADYGFSPDYPFDGDFDTAVLRHTDNRKWFAIIMRVSRKKFGFASGDMIDVVNLKLPQEVLDQCQMYLNLPADTRTLYNDLWTQMGVE